MSRDDQKLLLKSKRALLKDFGMSMTKDIEDRIVELYPNEIAIENYTRKLILDYLAQYD